MMTGELCKEASNSSVPPKVYEGFLLPGQTVDNIDCRADIGEFCAMKQG